MLLDTSAETYFSPYGVKTAPLRNIQLSNALKIDNLLEDGRYTVFQLPANTTVSKRANKSCQALLVVWTAITWILFAGLILGIIKYYVATWVSLATCTAFTGWSILVRLIEYVNVVPSTSNEDHVNDPDALDAVFIMGRSHSAFVLEGSRSDVKNWTSNGLIYKDRLLGIPASAWQFFTRMGSLMILLLFLTAIPNGSTADQAAFVLLNIVAQANVLVGQRANSRCVLSKLSKIEDTNDPRNFTRTHIYAKLIRRFLQVEHENQWIEASGMLPRTDVWDKWKVQIVSGVQEDPKKLFHRISNDLKNARTASILKRDANAPAESK